MKIAFVGEAVSGFGGMETVIRKVIKTFMEETPSIDCRMFFFCRNDSMDKQWLVEGAGVSYSYSSIKISALRRIRHIRTFASWLRKERPDVVICIDMIACLLVNRARLRAGMHFPLFSWPHFSLDHKKHADCVIHADLHLAISSGIQKQLMARGVPQQKTYLIYNPVSEQQTVIPAPGSSDVPTFLYIGRMKFEGQKRIKDLLDGLARFESPWKLHVIGDGSDYARCREYAKTLNIDERICWYGWQLDPWKLVRQDIKAVTALLLTSAFEGFPMTLLEAMSFGIPCVSSQCVSGPEDIIQNGRNGWLYPPGDLDKLVAVLHRVSKEGIEVDREMIKASIHRFYDRVYFEKLKQIIVNHTENTV
ncbi:lipopolysaccharide 1,6-galactosyltransferase [Enterobacteriaceae bacterium BIT-l23]|uniref:lipopolysaccharide 1,6-galactosyltransferase n=1 Tax=Jejubacter sp. L23 TaxID=3092086 RepID=UPI0015857E09|nr:lipopolysaccharide 1,6-galactosyltransferase [Enterobacteriaceae bacterium BIT-l23]